MPLLDFHFACCACPPVSRHRCVPRSPNPSESSFAERLGRLYLPCLSFCDMLSPRSAGVLWLCHRALGSVPSGGFSSSWAGLAGARGAL